jgi:exocyst complex protein 7
VSEEARERERMIFESHATESIAV